MNIFILDYDLQKCAEYHCDKHIVKMITETAQLLSSAYYYTDVIPDNIYKLCYKNHPCAKWVRESLSNWIWLQNFGLTLYKEYQYRYGNKEHKAGEKIKNMPIPILIDIGLTPFAQAMPNEYKNEDAVVAYRQYYNGEKQHLFTWKNREVPFWIEYEL